MTSVTDALTAYRAAQSALALARAERDQAYQALLVAESAEQGVLPPDESLEIALGRVCAPLVQDAETRRAQTQEYQDLFVHQPDGGIGQDVRAALDAMEETAMSLMQHLRTHYGLEIDDDLRVILLGLPLAAHLLRQDIETIEGYCCCADKTRFLLRAFFRHRLPADILATINDGNDAGTEGSCDG